MDRRRQSGFKTPEIIFVRDKQRVSRLTRWAFGDNKKMEGSIEESYRKDTRETIETRFWLQLHIPPPNYNRTFEFEVDGHANNLDAPARDTRLSDRRPQAPPT
jgi:hypothetical protein